MGANTEIMTEIGGPLGENGSVKQLLHVGDDAGVESTDHQVFDANGTAVGMHISTTGMNHPTHVEAVSANKTLDAADGGKVFMTGTDAVVFTLPATVAGLIYTFVCTTGDGAALMSISPNSSDAIHGSIVLAASTLELSGTDNKDAKLTKSTQNTGDFITIVGDGVVGWFVIAAVGIWASES